MSLDKLREKMQDSYLMLHFYKLPLAEVLKGKEIVFPTITLPRPALATNDEVWRKCSKKEIRETLRFLLRMSLAYGGRKTGRSKSVDPDEILNLFADEDYSYFDSGTSDNRVGYPLTKSTFDR